MCGIAGVVQAQKPTQERLQRVAKMTDSLHRRGPDGSGIFHNDKIVFGHRRLSILDLDNGAQPLVNTNENLILTYNGEIYNYREIRSELVMLGHDFNSNCDTEVLLHAWEEWGQSCVDRFRGMFAFAIWDHGRNLCFIVRDRLGIKPLYYAKGDSDEFLFGSELKALLSYGLDTKELDLTAVDDYFALGYVPEPKCIYKGVYKLRAGHMLCYDLSKNTIKETAYWNLRQSTTTNTSRDLPSELNRLLSESVNLRMVSDVPIGAFLSGGVDSSSVATLMSRLSDDAINTCSIGFSEAEFDESEYASSVAKKIGSKHNTKKVTLFDTDLIDQLADTYDEPFADSSALPTYRLCALAKDQVTVALSGDGGDELLGGYTRYRWHLNEERFRRLLPDSIRCPLFSLAAKIYPRMSFAPRWLRLKSTLAALGRDSVSAYFNNIAVIPDDRRYPLYSDTMVAKVSGYNPVKLFRDYAREADSKDALWTVQYIDIKTYLPGDILTKVDRASMAHGLEVRVPILDHKVVEWGATLAEDQRINQGEGKYVLKKSMEHCVDEDILYRRKMGFGVPLSQWFRNQLKSQVESLIDNKYLLKSGLFDMQEVCKLVNNHLSGLHDNGTALWSMLMFEAFLRRVHYEGETL
ncbi:amidotransferase 1, exosortase A system-associated [Aestuariirhabdus sp. Z084]|uniref:XrtA/PEP-CTERM system amidotransferase n=1 Tax=Aestuariirhabdus haliotis TaxID=2918751 RepID=UPI00201B3FFC|nr:XrtA/PEP-CTERM system amidotransferase [Aestuariirhabdus haliotis]MCL6414684.1 amidotransferase 1, exosortase A system-associated [Aestuariirhabdus haliotis]MCL6418616.1 amidotransferase 1, exosortase A system-associated [Aestuariirhabdus haliotis]